MRYKCQAMFQLLRPRVLFASLVLLVAAMGCAHPKPAPAPMVYRPAPPPLPPPPPPLKQVRLVVLPLDKLALPGTAEELNAKLAQVKLPGTENAVLATVSMETAQLQSECAEPSETCYLKIARLVEADRLLWAQVEKVAGKGKKKAKKSSTKIQIIVFDRDKLAVSGHSDGTFAGVVTGEELDKLIATATGVPPSPATAPGSAAPPAASPPPAAYPVTAQPQPAARPAYAPQPVQATAPAARAPAQQPLAPAQAGYRQPAAAPQPTYAQPTAAATPPAYAPPAASPPPAYAPPAASPPPAAAPPPPAYAPPAAAPPSAPSPSPARWQ